MALADFEVTGDHIGIDLKLEEAVIDHVNVILSHTEWTIFKFLWDAAGGWCRKETIFMNTRIGSADYVRYHIVQMRKKLGRDVILSRDGFGYRLNI